MQQPAEPAPRAPGHNSGITSIEAAYIEKTRKSAELSRDARASFPSGITHDARYLLPHGIYVERAAGAHKWDVDGNRYIDYFGGHGSLLLGHSPPAITEAVQEAYGRGTHFGSGHATEIEWAKLVRQLVPSAERVRFTSSGTEANSMAVRLARAYTGRSKVLRFRGQFHGWYDEASIGYSSHFDGTPTVGVSDRTAANVVLADPNDVDGVRDILSSDPDIAVVMLEALGGSTGKIPLRPGFHQALRELCDAHGTLLLFDEVVTGFRVSPGGVQAKIGVTPDLTSLAKILAGGLPGGAVAGRKEILDGLDHAAAKAAGREKIYHPGTYNANPVSAAAGVAMLREVANTNACKIADGHAAVLREGLREALRQQNVDWAIYGESSAVHIYMGAAGAAFDPFALSRSELQSTPPELARQLRLAMLLNGVDISSWPGMLANTALDDDDITHTVDAFAASLKAMKSAQLI
ncbi:MAG: aminotransferase class III-fold pyridoxal phosphate-dependent enzyme [Pseudomonadota bacterium]